MKTGLHLNDFRLLGIQQEKNDLGDDSFHGSTFFLSLFCG